MKTNIANQRNASVRSDAPTPRTDHSILKSEVQILEQELKEKCGAALRNPLSVLHSADVLESYKALADIVGKIESAFDRYALEDLAHHGRSHDVLEDLAGGASTDQLAENGFSKGEIALAARIALAAADYAAWELQGTLVNAGADDGQEEEEEAA